MELFIFNLHRISELKGFMEHEFGVNFSTLGEWKSAGLQETKMKVTGFICSWEKSKQCSSFNPIAISFGVIGFKTRKI
jgi:hypothetical protein